MLLVFRCFLLVWLLQSLPFLSLVIFLFLISLTTLRQPEESYTHTVHTVHIHESIHIPYIQYIYMRVYTCTYSTYTWYSLPVNTHFKTVPSLHLQGPLICQNYPCSSVAINLSLIVFSLCCETNIYRSYPFVSALGTTPIKFITFCGNLDNLDGLHACSLWVYICDQ